MLSDLMEALTRLFARRWERVVANDFEGLDDFDVLELITANLGAAVDSRAGDEVLLRSPAGRIVRVRPEGAERWPSRLIVGLPRGLGLDAAPRPTAIDGLLGDAGGGLGIDELLVFGRPEVLMCSASPAVLDRLRGLVCRSGDRLEGDVLHLAVPRLDRPWGLLERLQSVLRLVDLVQDQPLTAVLAERFEQRSEPAWARYAQRALATVPTDDPAFAGLQLSCLRHQPETVLAAAALDLDQARASLHDLHRDRGHREEAQRLLLRLPPDADTAALLQGHLSLGLCLALVARPDGFLGDEALAELDRLLDQDVGPPHAPALLAASRDASSTMKPRLLARLAPWIHELPAAERAEAAEAVLLHGDPAAAGAMTVAVCSSCAPGRHALPRGLALRLLPRLAESPHVDARLAPLLGEGVPSELLAALNRRFECGRSLALVASLVPWAPSLARPAADDLVQLLARAQAPARLPLLCALLDHPEPDVVRLAAPILAAVGGHPELVQLGRRSSRPDTPDWLRAELRQALDAIELRLGPIQRGGLSVAADQGGELALIAGAGELALADSGDD